MAIFGNFKGTTTSEFKIGKKASGSKISTGTRPSSDLSNGDIYFDSANATLDIYETSWKNIGQTLTELNVDDGTLFVDSTNDTVSIGSTASNERLFVNGNLRLGTNPSIQFSGSALDLRHSNGTATQVRIRDNSSSSDPIFKVYDADNTNEVFKVQGNEVLYSDNVKAKFGTGGDLEIHHDGSNSYITDVGTGSLYLRGADILLTTAGGTKYVQGAANVLRLYHTGNEKLRTSSTGVFVTGTVTATGIDVTGNLEVSGNLNLVDNVKAKFGTGGDLEIYHDGTNSYIDDAGTGSLKLRSGTFTVSNAAGSKTSAVFNSGGSQDLYHDHSKKFETTNSGIQTTGTVNVNGAYTLPTTDGSADQVLKTDGSGTLSFTTVSANPEGGNTDIQFNDSSSFGGNDALTYDKSSSTLKTGVVQGVLFEPISDYGSITDTANMVISFGTVEESATVGDYEYIKDTFGPTSDSYVVANLPDSSVAGQMIYVSDETGGAVMAFSDGSNWRRITDRAIVS